MYEHFFLYGKQHFTTKFIFGKPCTSYTKAEIEKCEKNFLLNFILSWCREYA